MIRRVAGIAAGLVLLATAGWGIQIPITTTNSTGFTNAGIAISNASVDTNWNFYVGNTLSALNGTALPAYVYTQTSNSSSNPYGAGVWAPSNGSKWITPVQLTGTNLLTQPFQSSYVVATSFQIPGPAQLPSGWSQWLLVMSGTVWADDTVQNGSYYLIGSQGNVVYSGSLSNPVSGTTSATFSFRSWVDPGATYRLAFIIPNASQAAGFRLEFTDKYVTPEPGAWALMLSAGAGLAYLSWLRRRAKKPQS